VTCFEVRGDRRSSCGFLRPRGSLLHGPFPGFSGCSKIAILSKVRSTDRDADTTVLVCYAAAAVDARQARVDQLPESELPLNFGKKRASACRASTAFSFRGPMPPAASRSSLSSSPVFSQEYATRPFLRRSKLMIHPTGGVAAG